MFCRACGKENADDAKFCGGCRADFGAPVAPVEVNAYESIPGEQMPFGKAISVCMGKYVDFSGRASRSEYWWFYLFTVLLSWGSMIVDSSGIISGIVNLAFLLPSLAAAARRLHDTNRSGWWMLISLTIIGLIPLIIWLATAGSRETNQYGEPV